jgi:primosomal protein N''
LAVPILRDNAKLLQNSPDLAQKLGRKRKRSHEPENAALRSSFTPPPNRPRTLPPSCAVDDTSNQKAKSDIDKKTQPITHWIREGSWPKEYFEQDNQTKEGLERYTCLEDFLIKQMMANVLTKKKSSSSLRRKDSEPSLATPSDQQPRETKSSKYMTASYETVLAAKGSYMGRAPLAITDTSKSLCRSLLDKEQTVPQETLFRDDLFEETCDRVRGRNEAMVVRHISPLICPSPLALRIDGATDLDFLTESVNEGWNSAIPVIYSRPQPDYSVGFARSAFTDEQLEKLRPLVGEIEDCYTSFFMSTWRMYFPFLTCEVKCGAASLDVADRQNAHSMTIAVRAVVQLYRHVKREKEIHREILAFSISHDNEAVRIFGHYPVIDGDNTTFWRHPIHKFDFTALDGKDKWTAYKFTKNLYDVWMPTHIKRIRSAIDDLPSGITFEVSVCDSFTSVASADESELLDSQDMATSAPTSQEREFKIPELPRAKKPKLQPKAMLEQEVERLREQMAQEKEESKQRHKELTEQNKELMGMLKQRIT